MGDPFLGKSKDDQQTVRHAEEQIERKFQALLKSLRKNERDR